jgi:hypothetical protein
LAPANFPAAASSTMVFHAHAGLHVDHIPDIIISDLIGYPSHGRRLLLQSNESLLVNAPSGNAFDIDTPKERTEAFAMVLN